jgi:hypothetical protein
MIYFTLLDMIFDYDNLVPMSLPPAEIYFLLKE